LLFQGDLPGESGSFRLIVTGALALLPILPMK